MSGKSLARIAQEEAEAAEGADLQSSWHPAFPKRAEDFCLLGATNDDLAERLGVHVSTIQQWIVEKPEFARAIRRGREGADERVSRAAYRRATGFKVDGRYYPPSDAMIQFWLVNRQGRRWKDKRLGDDIASASVDLVELIKAAASRTGEEAKVVEGTSEVIEPDKAQDVVGVRTKR